MPTRILPLVAASPRKALRAYAPEPRIPADDEHMDPNGRAHLILREPVAPA